MVVQTWRVVTCENCLFINRARGVSRSISMNSGLYRCEACECMDDVSRRVGVISRWSMVVEVDEWKNVGD